MRNTVAVIVASAVLGLLGCLPTPLINRKLDALADRACACRTSDCATQVISDMVDLSRSETSWSGEEGRARTSARRIGECAIKAGMDIDLFASYIRKMRPSR